MCANENILRGLFRLAKLFKLNVGRLWWMTSRRRSYTSSDSGLFRRRVMPMVRGLHRRSLMSGQGQPLGRLLENLVDVEVLYRTGAWMLLWLPS